MLIYSFIISFIQAAAFYEMQPRSTWDLRQPAMMFDLDNTLYRYSDYDINSRMMSIQYLRERRGMSAMEAQRLLTLYNQKYDGVVARGLAQELGLDPLDYERYLSARSNIPQIVRPDPRLAAMLGRMKARRYVLTNSGLDHALMALKALGVQDKFHGIVYVDYGRRLFTAKPDAQIYREAMRFAAVSRPSDAYFLDDRLSYARSARALGWNAYYLSPDGRSLNPSLNFPGMRSIYDLPNVIPGLF